MDTVRSVFSVTPTISHLSLPVAAPHTTTIGRFRVSSLSKQLDDGRFRASVSIRSGHGSACTDRVMRFTDTFDNAAQAHDHAHAQGLAWVAHTLPRAGLAQQAGA
jgi:hypothetical protein